MYIGSGEVEDTFSKTCFEALLQLTLTATQSGNTDANIMPHESHDSHIPPLNKVVYQLKH